MSVPVVEREGSEIVEYDGFAVEYRDASHRYWIITRENERYERGMKVVEEPRTPAISVTSALKVLDKPALLSWAERCGVEGALRMERDGRLARISIPDALGVIRSHGEGADAKREAGADRGTAIHDALRLYCTEATIPTLSDFDPEVRGYVSGLCAWLIAASPEPLLVEQIVASRTHSYAGRVDLVARIEGRRVLVDLKTNPAGRVYMEAHLQAAAYMGAMGECGLPVPDGGLIVAAGVDGVFATQVCCSEHSHFLAVLATHRALAAVRSAQRGLERDAA